MNDCTTENGACFYNVSTDEYDHLNFKTLLGVEVRYDIDESFTLVGRAFWSHEFGDNTYDVDYRIAAANFMPKTKYKGEEINRNAAILGIGAQYKFSDDISAFLDYSATVRDDYLSHGLNIGAQFRF